MIDISSFNLLGWFSPETLKEGLLEVGAWGPLIYMFVSAGTVLVAFLPNGIVFFSGLFAFGVTKAVLFGFAGALLGACLAFFLARRFGQPLVSRIVGQEKIAAVEERFGLHQEKRLTMIIFLFRLVPFVSFDVISYLAGLSRLSFGKFLLASVGGALPGTIAYLLIGPHLGPWVFGFGVAWTLLMAVIVLPIIFWRKAKKQP